MLVTIAWFPPPAFSGMSPNTKPSHAKQNPPLRVAFGGHNLMFLDLILLECIETSDNYIFF